MAKRKPRVKKEPKVTDIKREYFMEGGIEKVKCTYLNGSKLVKEEIEIS